MLKSNFLIVAYVLCLSVGSTVFLFQNFSYADNSVNYYKIENVSLDLEEENYSGESDFSFGVSNPSTDNNTWSTIKGEEVNVHPNEKYFINSHMALNEYAVQSHIYIEGYNKTSESWNQIIQCPRGFDGPLKLTQFVCEVVILPDITKIRPVFESGWSSMEGKKALTTFEKFLIIKEPDQPDRTPILFDKNLVLQKVISSYLSTSKMKFLGVDDILLIDEPKGLIYRLLNGTLIGPLLDSNLAGNSVLVGLESIRGLDNTKVYLYYYENESNTNEEIDVKIEHSKCLCLYQYDLVDNKLINPKLWLEIPEDSLRKLISPGYIELGPKNDIFLVFSIRDTHRNPEINSTFMDEDNNTSNNITRVLQFPLDKNNDQVGSADLPNPVYYSDFKIPNSFGISFDPVSKNLWIMGENVTDGSESSNLIVKSIPNVNNTIFMDEFDVSSEYKPINRSINPSQMILPLANDNYSKLEYIWNWPNGPNTIGFLNSSKLGDKYANTIFVSEPEGKYIYNFDLDEDRTELELSKPYDQRIANDTEDLASVIFAFGLGNISDIQTGPDGLLYLLDNQGQIFRVITKNY